MGDELTAAGKDIQAVVKTAAESVSSSTTMQDDDELSLELEAKKYALELDVHYSTNEDFDQGGRLNMELVGPSGATAKLTISGNDSGTGNRTPGTSEAGFGFGVTQTPLGNRTDKLSWVRVTGILDLTGAPGTVKLRWAQWQSSTDPTTLHQGSQMVAKQI